MSRAADNGVLDPRPALTRAESSDVAFLHTVLDVTQKLASQTAVSGVARVLDTRVTGAGAHRIRVDCVQCDVPARRVSVSADGRGWAIEHVAGGHISVVRNGAAAASHQGATDVRCVWWISDTLVGVAADALCVYAIDALDGSVRRTELAARARVGAVAGRGAAVCAESAGGLRLWHLDAARGAAVARTVAEDCAVVGLRWVADGVGLAATRTGAFWFDVRGARAPLGLPAGLSAATLLSWRWQQAVVAVAGDSFPPRAGLCLPSATGAAFHCEGRTHARTFERGWVWLCGSPAAYAVLSPERRQAAVCRMPGGQRLFTLETAAVIQDGWMEGGACAISTGAMLYLVSFDVD
ncbi:hypothetical protein IWW57_004512 [Coemansia sp. S610]|nr:hypothetical protein IWW57_004512 [Coemansia sp. S610]KAJ2415218.1 hypothetical protein GGI10_001847 [Coemansia sp. RSA 2530]KAJ2696232.1 hypothetical protein H4218_004741 [Coemansia sp. IMI 209128]